MCTYINKNINKTSYYNKQQKKAIHCITNNYNLSKLSKKLQLCKIIQFSYFEICTFFSFHTTISFAFNKRSLLWQTFCRQFTNILTLYHLAWCNDLQHFKKQLRNSILRRICNYVTAEPIMNIQTEDFGPWLHVHHLKNFLTSTKLQMSLYHFWLKHWSNLHLFLPCWLQQSNAKCGIFLLYR